MYPNTLIGNIIKTGKRYFILMLLFVFYAATGCSNSSFLERPFSSMGLSSQNTEEVSQSVDLNKQIITAPLAKQMAFPEVTPIPRLRVALLLPLSGSSQKIGESMLDAAYMAALDIGSNNINIIPIDTSDNQISAIQAVNKAISEKVDIILGPLFADATAAVVPIAQEHGINVISFSNDRKLTEKGAFLLGFMPEQQIRRVVNYVADVNNITAYSAFVPDNEFGKVTAQELSNIVQQRGFTIEQIEYYASGGSGEQVDLVKVIEVNSKSTGAILIPEGGERIKEITKLIKKHNITQNKAMLIGSGQWDDSGLLNIRELKGGIFSTSPPAQRKEFEEHFKNTYGYTPLRITSLAYDAVALSVFLAQNGADFSRAAITNPRGFAALNGIFRFRNDGICERGLSVLKVGDKEFIEVDPAPKAFTTAY